MLGDLNQKQIESVLYSQIIGRIGCYADGKVYVVPISYVYKAPYIYGHSKVGLKVNMMRQNPQVCFQVDAIQNTSTWQSVIVQGEYEELTGEDTKEASEVLNNRITPLLVNETTMPTPMHDTHQSNSSPKEELVIYRIRITHMTGRYENHIRTSA